MVLSARWSKNSNGGWGMGGFLIFFFPEDDSNKKTLLSLRRPAATAAFSGRLISKTQSTLSICGLLFFTTFLIFTLSTFDTAAHHHRTPRRLVLTDHPPSRRPSFPLATRIVKLFNPGNPRNGEVKRGENVAVKALQGMGVVYRRGTRAMADLIVAHVSDAVEEREFRAFLRALHNNGVLARSDLVFIFSSCSISSKLSPLIREENESLLKLVWSLHELKRRNHDSQGLAGLTRYLRTKIEGKKEAKEAIWGKGFRATNYSGLNESTRPSYGSVVGFDASELDPANSLSGFMDPVPLGLRRWACYPMLLGRIRRTYKHMALADVSSVVILNDPFTRLRNRSPASIYLWTQPDSELGKRGKRQPTKVQQEPAINPGIVAGGSRGVRRLSDAVLMEIVRAAIAKAGKNSITESRIVSRLVYGEHLLKNVNVIGLAEPVPDAGEVFGSGSKPGSVNGSTATVAQWGHSSVTSVRDLWCWSDLHVRVYWDCLATQ